MINLRQSPEIVDWLLTGDVAIQYQTQRDLLAADRATCDELQNRIAGEGWGARYLVQRRPDGHWGRGYYQPKWTSTHYTLLELKNLGLPADNSPAADSTIMLLNECMGIDGGIIYSPGWRNSDVCINGMVLNFGSWFAPHHPTLKALINFLLDARMNDGGWNCRHLHGATHSSLHTTISVLEGLSEYRRSGGNYQLDFIRSAEQAAVEFLLEHHLFRSSRTGAVINPKFLLLSWPCRWQYDILRALDYFQLAAVDYDSRMQPARDILLQKRRRDGRWPLQNRHPGQTHFEMEQTGQPSRWNTLRALRVLQAVISKQ
ncbi:MAG: hypothetical protein ABIA75_13400 [Candidatus Neomarinimicrobiota bacterium]